MVIDLPNTKVFVETIGHTEPSLHTSSPHLPPQSPSLTLGSVIDSEVGSSVDDDALDRDTETLVETLHTIRLEDLAETVAQPTELSLSRSLAYIGSQPGSSKVQRVDKAEGGGTSCPTGSQVTGEVAPELLMPIHTPQEDLLVLVLEGEVESLGGEVPDHIGQVTPPEGEKALLLGDSHDAINDALVLFVCTDLFAGMLDLVGDREGWVTKDRVKRREDKRKKKWFVLLLISCSFFLFLKIGSSIVAQASLPNFRFGISDVYCHAQGPPPFFFNRQKRT